MRKKYTFVLMVLYVIYAYAIATVNNFIGDMLSPVLTLIVTGFIFYGFTLKEEKKIYKIAGLLLALALFSWFLCDLLWAISAWILHIDPETNIFTVYGYSLTNLFLFLSLIVSGINEVKKLNKIIVLLDTLIVSICTMFLLWVFIFGQDIKIVDIIKSDFIFAITWILDIIIYAWTTVWYFSTRSHVAPLFYKLTAAGGIVFVIADFSYYYVYFFTGYIPNSWIDGAYMIAFSMMAIGAYIKTKEKIDFKPMEPQDYRLFHVGKEAMILAAPLLIIIFKSEHIYIFFILLISILIYYILLNYTQKNVLREELLEVKIQHVAQLESKVEERTNEILQIMYKDYVTGLNNRRFFESKLSEICNCLNKEERVAVLYIDQNKFKAIKSLYGKSAAESLLREVGKAMERIIAAVDNCILASYGEDTFIAMIKSNTADLEASILAEKIINQCSHFYLIENHEIRVTLNIGISCYPLDTNDYENLLKNSDFAMIQSKASGFNKIMKYNDQIGNHIYNRHRLEMKLKNVAFDEEFLLHYQPQVSCENGELCGFEALIRWIDKDKNYISPAHFIPITEETGLIVPLGDWIMEEAAKQISYWNQKNNSNYRMSINVSSKQLIEKEFVNSLKNVLRKYNLAPESFEIEITENQQIENSYEVLETLNEISKLGISIAIDDFGTGYSSLYYLKNLPIDRIKIAKELVDNIENDVFSHSIIQMSISVAKVKGIKVIAEGVETKEQWECLKKLECDEIQGYYFAKPMSADVLEETWLTKSILMKDGNL